MDTCHLLWYLLMEAHSEGGRAAKDLSLELIQISSAEISSFKILLKFQMVFPPRTTTNL